MICKYAALLGTATLQLPTEHHTVVEETEMDESVSNFFSLSACCTTCFTVWNKFRLRMMLLCSVDLLYYSLIGLAIYHFIGELHFLSLDRRVESMEFSFRSVVRGLSHPRSFRCCFPLGYSDQKNLPSTRYANIHGHHSGNEDQRRMSMKATRLIFLVVCVSISIDLVFMFVMFLSLFSN